LFAILFARQTNMLIFIGLSLARKKTTLSKSEIYRALEKDCANIVQGESDVTANLANICALMKQHLEYFWIGFYLVKDKQLVLGPFQGPVACTRIDIGRGVCGTSWERKKAILVPDVHAFPGHISCNANSQSEIVFPILKKGAVEMILDIDSDKLNDFDNEDMAGVEAICKIIEKII
jgi:L-methionine (R)-S-oxide reductase